MEKELQILINDFVKRYDYLGFRASGRFEEEIEYNVSDSGSQITGTILGGEHSYFMENQRGAGKQPPFRAIRQWVSDKGLVAKNMDSLAWAIVHKIKNEGVNDRPDLFAEIFTKERAENIVKNVGLGKLNVINSNVIKKIKT